MESCGGCRVFTYRANVRNITILQGSLLEVEARAVVNAAIVTALWGVASLESSGARAGHKSKMKRVDRRQFPVGTAVLTSGGRTRFGGIIHAPTMPEPAMRIPRRTSA